MKWNVDKMSPIIDGIISVSIFIILLWAIPDDWFASAHPVEYPNFIILTVVIYNIGVWSGRRFEHKKRGNQ